MAEALYAVAIVLLLLTVLASAIAGVSAGRGGSDREFNVRAVAALACAILTTASFILAGSL